MRKVTRAALIALAAVGWCSPSYGQCPEDRCRGGVDYLFLWAKGSPLPPLVTTGPLVAPGVGARPGALGFSGTQTLVGGTSLGFGPSSGVRVWADWLPAEDGLGAEASYFYLGERSDGRFLSQPGTPGSVVLSVPFRDAQAFGRESSTGIALPRAVNPFSGAVDLEVTTRLHGGDASALWCLGRWGGARATALAGYRYLELTESLRFDTRSANVPPAPPDVFVTSDRFRTENDFHGAQLGVRGEYDADSWGVSAFVKMAMGVVRQRTRIDGSLVTNDFTDLGPLQTFQGGYLAQPTNIGSHSRYGFCVVPEVNLSFVWRPKSWLGVRAGYSFLYLSDVARPGDQIDRLLNPSQNPSFFGVTTQRLFGAAHPAFTGRESEFWVQGLHAGVELCY